jgi:hypothetical protein
MATLATLGIINGLDGVDIDPVAPVALRLIVAAEIIQSRVIPRTAARVAIQAELLGMALLAVLHPLARQHPVTPYPVAVMVGSDTFRLVAFIALRRFQLGIILMVLFLLLGQCLMHIERCHQDEHKSEQQFSHGCPPFLEIVIIDDAALPVIVETPVDIVLDAE